jgi:hypothetical protein
MPSAISATKRADVPLVTATQCLTFKYCARLCSNSWVAEPIEKDLELITRQRLSRASSPRSICHQGIFLAEWLAALEVTTALGYQRLLNTLNKNSHLKFSAKRLGRKNTKKRY